MKASLKEKLVVDFRLNDQKTIAQAAEVLPKVSVSKFSGSVDIDVVLNLKEKQKKESIRGVVSLPHKFGADKKVIVFCSEKDIEKAKAAGATEAGLDELKQKVLDGKVEFDVVIATPDAMPKIIQLGKVLGPTGLMPNPKNGTVVTDVAEAIKGFVGGKMSFKMVPGQGIIRNKVAKVDMTTAQIVENITAYLKGVFAETKKLSSTPFKKVVVKPTMGPSIRLDVNDILAQM